MDSTFLADPPLSPFPANVDSVLASIMAQVSNLGNQGVCVVGEVFVLMQGNVRQDVTNPSSFLTVPLPAQSNLASSRAKQLYSTTPNQQCLQAWWVHMDSSAGMSRDTIPFSLRQ